MSRLVTSYFKNHIAAQISESFIEPANNVYYMLASRHIPYPQGDDNILAANNSTAAVFIEPYEQGIFAKKIQATDTARMAHRYDWVSNTIYDSYDSDADLTNKQFYVSTTDGSTYFIYKCLDNNGNTASTYSPADTVESACSFSTSDGYVWKLMYKMANNDFLKFASDDYMPVVTSANVAGNTVPGAIDVIRVTNAGSDYISTFTGTFNIDDLRDSIPTIIGSSTTYRLANTASANANFYINSAMYITGGAGMGGLRKITEYDHVNKVVVVETPFSTQPSAGSTYLIAPNVVVAGDGTANVTGYATVSSNATVNNFISKINIVERGAGFTYGTAEVQGNTGGVSNSAVLKVIIPPQGGHGADAENELGATSFGIGIEFTGDENGYVTTQNDYRSIYILKDPLLNNVTLELANNVGTFLGTEEIVQVSYKTLAGIAVVDTTNSTITGISTEFNSALKTGDEVIIYDTVNNTRCLRTVESIANSTSVTLSSAPTFNSTIASVQFIERISTGTRAGGSLPYLNMNSVEPKFQIGKNVIGVVSGAWGNVSAITINDVEYNNFNTLDNRTRVPYNSIVGTLNEDAEVYQVDLSVANAYVHSTNNTYLFLTSERGVINPNLIDTVKVVDSNTTIIPGIGTRYSPDIVKGSGNILYVENLDPITRDDEQSEAVRVILNF